MREEWKGAWVKGRRQGDEGIEGQRKEKAANTEVVSMESTRRDFYLTFSGKVGGK